MKKLIIISLCLALVSTIFSVSAEIELTENHRMDEEVLVPCEATVEDNFVTGEIMVGIKSAYSTVNKIWTAADFSELSGITNIQDLTYADTEEAVTKFSSQTDFHQLLKISIANTTKAAVIAGIEALEQNDKLLFAEPNLIIELEESFLEQENVTTFANNLSLNNIKRYQKYTNDTLLLQQDGIFLHNVDKAWNAFTKGSTAVKVGILDGGVYRHNDLRANLTYGYDCSQVDDDNSVYVTKDTNYSYYINHGTGVASVVGARGNNGIGMSGVCQQVTIVPFIITRTGPSESKYVAQAILKANVQDIPILNISFAYGAMNQQIAKIAASMYDGLIVVSAGNHGERITSTSNHAPLFDLDNVIVVGGLEQYDSNGDGVKEVHLWDDTYVDGTGVTHILKSCYSTTYVDIMALANETYACNSPLEGGGYSKWCGTSTAAPFVAGVAALLLSYDNTLTAAQLKQYILDGAQTSANLTDYCVNGRYLDAYGAFLAMKGQRATCVNLRVGQYDNSLSYNFTINYNPTYAQLSEIVIPDAVATEMLPSSSITFTSTSVIVHLDLGYVLEFGDLPIMEFHFISYNTPTYAKAYVGLSTESIVDFDGNTQTNIVIPSKKLLVGDANGDGAVNIADSQLIMQYTSNPNKITGDHLLAADVNGDSLVNAVDSLRISNYSVSKLYAFF